MKILTITLAAAALAMSSPAFAAEGHYVGVDLGWAQHSAVDASQAASLPASSDKENFSDSIAYAGVLGHQFSTGWRLELEVGKAQFDTSDSGSSGGIATTLYLANVQYDVPLRDKIAFTIGAGFGGAAVKTDLNLGGVEKIKGDDGVVAFQGLAGLTFHASDVLDVQLDYRYRSIGDITPGGRTATASGDVDFSNIHENVVMVSARWFFGN